MNEYKFFGWQNVLNIKAVNHIYNQIQTPLDLYNSLYDLWCEQTCAPRLRKEWSLSNRTRGQCSITAFLAQDIFGGEVYGIKTKEGGIHCYNVVNGIVFDLTSEQFGDEAKNLVYKDNPVQNRNSVDHFLKQEKYERYIMLKNLLSEKK